MNYIHKSNHNKTIHNIYIQKKKEIMDAAVLLKVVQLLLKKL